MRRCVLRDVAQSIRRRAPDPLSEAHNQIHFGSILSRCPAPSEATIAGQREFDTASVRTDRAIGLARHCQSASSSPASSADGISSSSFRSGLGSRRSTRAAFFSSIMVDIRRST